MVKKAGQHLVLAAPSTAVRAPFNWFFKSSKMLLHSFQDQHEKMEEKNINFNEPSEQQQQQRRQPLPAFPRTWMTFDIIFVSFLLKLKLQIKALFFFSLEVGESKKNLVLWSMRGSTKSDFSIKRRRLWVSTHPCRQRARTPWLKILPVIILKHLSWKYGKTATVRIANTHPTCLTAQVL